MSKRPSGLPRMPWRGSTKAFFDLLDWTAVPERAKGRAWPGPQPHPRAAYIKALLDKLREGKPYVSQLRRFLVHHPVLVLLSRFVPQSHACQPLGIQVTPPMPHVCLRV